MLFRPVRRPAGLALRYVTGVLIVLAGTLALVVALLQPERSAFLPLALAISAAALIASAAGLLIGWWGRSARAPGLRALLGTGALLVAVLTFLNVWLPAQRGLAGADDPALITLLALFVAGMAAATGLYLAATVTLELGALARAAAALQAGNLAARVETGAGGEIGALAATLNQMAAQLEAAQANEREVEQLRRDLVSMVGNDVRAPLAAVQAMLEALNSGVDDPATVERALRSMGREVGAVTRLADDLHAIAQIDAGSLRPETRVVALAALISEALARIGVQAFEKNVALHGETGPGVDPVACDPALVARVLDHLLQNALRYTPPLGQVRVSALATPPGFVQVTVADTGPGIPSGELSAIFNRFYRVEKKSKRGAAGAGLGLAIAQGIVQAHGGSIRAESGRGPGARIVFTLPKGVAAPRPARPTTPGAGNPLTGRQSR